MVSETTGRWRGHWVARDWPWGVESHHGSRNTRTLWQWTGNHQNDIIQWCKRNDRINEKIQTSNKNKTEFCSTYSINSNKKVNANRDTYINIYLLEAWCLNGIYCYTKLVNLLSFSWTCRHLLCEFNWCDLIQLIPETSLLCPVVYYVLAWFNRAWNTLQTSDCSTKELTGESGWTTAINAVNRWVWWGHS